MAWYASRAERGQVLHRCGRMWWPGRSLLWSDEPRALFPCACAQVAIEMQQLADVPEDQAAGPAPSGPAQTFVDLGWTPAAAAAGRAVEASTVDPSASGFTWLGASTSLLVPPPPPPLDS